MRDKTAAVAVVELVLVEISYWCLTSGQLVPLSEGDFVEEAVVVLVVVGIVVVEVVVVVVVVAAAAE